jgi:hypothetical protein
MADQPEVESIAVVTEPMSENDGENSMDEKDDNEDKDSPACKQCRVARSQFEACGANHHDCVMPVSPDFIQSLNC